MRMRALIAGVGETKYVRGTDRSLADVATEAGLTICADAGIEPSTVDGIVVAGFRGRIEDLAVGLRVRDLKFSSRIEMGGASSVAGLVHAAAAVLSGQADRVLVTAVRFGYSQSRFGAGGDNVVTDLTRFFPSSEIRVNLEHPYGVLVPMQYYALQATRWFSDHGIGPDDMAQVALETRQHAQRNPRALMHDRALTMEQYVHSPVVASPFRTFDCCLESDGAAGVLVCSLESAMAGRRPVWLAGAAEAHADSPDDIVSRPDIIEIGVSKAAPRAYAQAGVGPRDLDFLELYDCFTYTVLRQLEEIGFCERGSSPQFVRQVGIGVEGRLPINTHGGLLSEAHVLGMNHVVEAVRQLRGDAGPTQLPGRRWGAVTGYGDFGDGSVAILTNQ